MTLQDFAYLGNPITKTTYDGQDIESTIVDRNGETVATLRAESINETAQVDYAAVLRSIQENDGIASFDTVRPLWTYRNLALQVRATIDGTQYVFVRGVHQLGATTAERFKFLTNMPFLRHYAGYQLYVSYIIDNQVQTRWYVELDGQKYETDAILAGLADFTKEHATSELTLAPQYETILQYIEVNYSGSVRRYYYAYYDSTAQHPYSWQAKDGREDDLMYSDTQKPAVDDRVYSATEWPYRITAIGEEVSHTYGMLRLWNANVVRDSIQIVECQVPAHPFYVRWVNNRGGFDYFMFACQRGETKTLTENKTFERYGGNGERSCYHKAATRAVEVSTGVIDRQSLESVAELIYSPLVQVWDVSRNTWVEIQPATGKQDIMAEQPTGELLITFELPTPQLNK